ncbi:MAG TPA: O-antigen ligase family protein [Vicinamibacterales bacterium]|nr:O-antigen ligase family protein [Vicinamibacterales bacterium]
MPGLTLAGDAPRDRLELAALVALLGFAAALQLSIAAAHVLLAVAVACWIATLVRRHAGFAAPPIFTPLVVYAGLTLVASIFSVDPAASLKDSRQLVLFLIVPLVYQLAAGPRALRVADLIISVGAVSAIAGIVQYGILQYDHLGRRPQGTMGHYMTYSGLLMLVLTTAAARVLFRREDRTWPSLVLPALLVALALTFTRSAWVGACAGLAVLFLVRDFRLIALLPVLVALFVALAPARIADRIYSMFDLRDPSNRDRVAMLHAGVRMVADDPLTGVGPNMVPAVYPRYRDARAVHPVNPHLHNVPLQIAAERGLPALAAWIWFLVVAVRDLVRRLRATAAPSLAAGGLAALAAMLAAGFFEYNFGDSEFLMLLLVLLALPYAADRAPAPAVSAPAAGTPARR